MSLLPFSKSAPEPESMSWDEAETIARECSREFKAAEKIHLACVKVRTEAETVAKLKAEYDTVQHSLADAQTRLSDALTKAGRAEADAAERIAQADTRVVNAESRAVDSVAKVNQQAQQAKDDLAVARKAHNDGLVLLQQEAAKAKARAEVEHQATLAMYRDEEVKAAADRDKAVAMFKQYIQTVQG